jgi:aryl-alcohol dehydrogenase-like predicted oxidoreductase
MNWANLIENSIRRRREDIEVTDSTKHRIRTHRFGRTDLMVSEYGLGCARIGGVFKSNSGDFVKLLTTAADGGITFFDTADIYSQGESEQLLGRAFGRRRQDVVIASKAGYVLSSQRKLVARIKPLVRPLVKLLGLSRHHLPSAVKGELAQNFSPSYLKGAVEQSLRRLRTDYLDLLQLHSPPAPIVETGEWLEALDSLKQQGKIRYYGISCDTVDAASAALSHRGVSSLQLPLSLLSRGFLPVLDAARDAGVGVIARECLANGLLVKDLSLEQIRGYCRSDAEASDKASQVAAYRREAAAGGVTLQEFALQWVSQLPAVSVPLIGVTTLEQLHALLTSRIGTA